MCLFVFLRKYDFRLSLWWPLYGMREGEMEWRARKIFFPSCGKVGMASGEEVSAIAGPGCPSGLAALPWGLWPRSSKPFAHFGCPSLSSGSRSKLRMQGGPFGGRVECITSAQKE